LVDLLVDAWQVAIRKPAPGTGSGARFEALMGWQAPPGNVGRI
jgi:hypothetical protein